MPTEVVDIAKFKRTKNLLADTEWYFVVKSQDQIARRKTMLKGRKDGKYDKLPDRKPGVGLVVKAQLVDGRVRILWAQSFMEPRHLYWSKDMNALRVTTIDRIVYLDKEGRELSELRKKYFGSLHTAEGRAGRILIVSSGYDSVLEVRERDNERTFFWNAWEHGFTPDKDGYWLTLNPNEHERMKAEGKKSKLVQPKFLGVHGLLTEHRSAHPNVAVYDPGNLKTFILSIAYTGKLYRVKFKDGETELVCESLHQMPHGIHRIGDGWMVTDTTTGEMVRFSAEWKEWKRYSIARIPGKPKSVGDAEWLQTVSPTEFKCVFLFVDANRGLIAANTCSKQYTPYQPDMNWAIQDAVYIGQIAKEKMIGGGYENFKPERR